ncbi:hypothetical protein BSZ21_00060, partial [Bradyrhizobium canariense]
FHTVDFKMIETVSQTNDRFRLAFLIRIFIFDFYGVDGDFIDRSRGVINLYSFHATTIFFLDQSLTYQWHF